MDTLLCVWGINKFAGPRPFWTYCVQKLGARVCGMQGDRIVNRHSLNCWLCLAMCLCCCCCGGTHRAAAIAALSVPWRIHSPQSTCDLAPEVRVTSPSPHSVMLPLLAGLGLLSPPAPTTGEEGGPHKQQ